MSEQGQVFERLWGERDPRPHVLIIDGRSGSGKTTLAATLAPHLNARVLHMDDLYRGWQGLTDAPEHLAQALGAREYRRYDWATAQLAETLTLDDAQPLIVEGCGSLTAHTLDAAREFAAHVRGDDPHAVQSIWLDCPDDERKSRALARDGDMFRPHWDAWAAQEWELLDAHSSRDLADRRLNVTDVT